MTVETANTLSTPHQEAEQETMPEPPRGQKVRFSPDIQIIPADIRCPTTPASQNTDPDDSGNNTEEDNPSASDQYQQQQQQQQQRNPSSSCRSILKQAPIIARQQMLIETLQEMVIIAERRLRMHYAFVSETDLDRAFFINEHQMKLRAKRRAIRDAGPNGLTPHTFRSRAETRRRRRNKWRSGRSRYARLVVAPPRSMPAARSRRVRRAECPDSHPLQGPVLQSPAPASEEDGEVELLGP